MLLMAMHEVGAAQMREHRKRQRIAPLSAHVPRISDNAKIELTNTFAPVVRTEREQHGLDFICHVARKFKGIAFTAAEDPAFTENRGCNVEDSHASTLSARG
jgi:hypothetical protein